MIFCKTINAKYSPFIQERRPGYFEGYFLIRGKSTRRNCSNKISTIEQGETDLNKWLILYDKQMKELQGLEFRTTAQIVRDGY